MMYKQKNFLKTVCSCKVHSYEARWYVFCYNTLFCLDFGWQEYRLVLRQSVLLRCLTAICCVVLVALRRWELLLPALLLMMIAVIDMRHYIIPDVLLCGMMLGCMLADMLTNGLFWQQPAGQIVWHWVLRVGNGLAVGVPLLLFVLLMDRLLQKASMGGGDIKLLFVVGFCMDAISAVWVLYVACIVGLVWALISTSVFKEARLPFGPSIAIACGLILIGNTALSSKFFYILW